MDEHARQQSIRIHIQQVDRLILQMRDMQEQISKLKDDKKQQNQVMKGIEQRANNKFIVSIVLCLATFIFFYLNMDQQKALQHKEVRYLIVSNEKLDLEMRFLKENTLKLSSEVTKLNCSIQNFDLEIKNEKENTLKSLSQIEIKLKNSTQRLDLEIINRKENTMKLSSEISKIHYIQLKTTSDINLLNRFLMNEDLTKRYYPIMIKNSKKALFQLNKTNFEKNYAFKNQNTITKINYEKNNIIVYTQRPLITNQISYFSVRIQKMQTSDISIGVFTDKKLSQLKCGYCEQQTMYYIYSENANMYHGTYFAVFSDFEKSTISNLKEKDEITVFYEPQWKRIIFYVNQVYVGNILLKKEAENRQIYPFLIMGSKNNQILLL